MPVYDEKYIIAKVKELKKKKNYPQVYLEECKCKIKEIKMTKFINTELE